MVHTTWISGAFAAFRIVLVAAPLAAFLSCSVDSQKDSRAIEYAPGESKGLFLKVTKADGPRYARSFRALDGTIYLLGPLKSTDGGKTLVWCNESDPKWGTALNEREMNTIYSRKGLFIALRNKVFCDNGRCVGKLWTSLDDLKTIRERETVVIIPEAGKVDNGKPGEWAGLFFHRRIIEMPDGSLLAAMYGNFEQDTITPTNPRSKSETKYKLRAFVVRSTDQGKTWRYLSTVAAPSVDVVDDTEGFNEWTIEQLADGRLLGVIRTGHYTPMVASWSGDGGKTWTKPIAPKGLGPAGVDPYLLKLSDGRLALAYGQIVQPNGSREEYWKEYKDRADHRRCCQLAINSDGTGESWVATTVADYAPRSAYPTIFEVEPNVIVYQSDLELWRIELEPAKAS